MADQNPELFIRSFGRFVRVTHIAHSVDEANEWCAEHPDDGVLAEDGEEHIFLAKITDLGHTPMESDFLKPVSKET